MRIRHRRLGQFSAALLALALAAGACGGDKKSGGGDGSASGEPVEGGELRYGLEAETSGGWCLAESQLAAAGIQVANAIYDPLTAFDENLTAKPYLAESVTPNATASEFTIKLREGVKFHDGTDLTAEVVKENLDLLRGEKTAVEKYGRAPQLTPFIFAPLADVTVSDPLTVVVTTKAPWPAFPDYLASGRYGMMAKAQYSAPGKECAEKLIGTGPFKLVKWDRGNEMNLEKNGDYWRKDSEGRQLPYLDKVTFVPIEGGPNRYDALDGGTLNSLQTSSQEVFESIQSDPDRFSFFAENGGHHEVAYDLVNVREKRADGSANPLADKENRLHMAMAIDRTRLNDINANGQFRIANGPYDSEVPGYLDESELNIPQYDPEAAAEFFKGKNVKIRLSYAIDPSTEAVANEVKRGLEAAGVEVTIDAKDQATLISQAIAGDFDTILWRNHPGSDPDGQYVWWHSGSVVNFGGINDPAIDAALEAGRIETDPEKRRAEYEKVNKAFSDGAYNLWNWYTEWGIGTTSDVKNITSTELPGGVKGAGMNWGWHFLTETWIEE